MPSRRRVLAGLGAGAVASVAIAARGQSADAPPDWPMDRYDAAGTGHSPDASGPVDDVTVDWRREIGEAGTETVPSPILLDGTVYATGGGLVAVDAATGEVTARVERDRGRYGSTPAAVEARAYRTATLAATDSSGVHGLAASGGVDLLGRRVGARRWNGPATASGFDLFGPPEPTTPVAVDDLILAVVPGRNELVALDGSSGRTRWRYDRGEPMYRPAVRDGVAYLTSFAGPLVAVDLADGTERWRYDATGDDLALRPTATDAGLVVPTRSNVRLVDIEDRTERWLTDVEDLVELDSAAAVANGRVFLSVGSGDGTMYALDLASGDEVWSRTLDGGGTPVVADGTVYVPARNGRALVAFDAADGDRRWEFDPWTDERTPVIGGLSTPAVGDGRLYVRTREELLALEGSA